jgi:hypothetical protein
MNTKLFDAILAMDSYNRGYNYGIDLGGGENSQAVGTEISNLKIVNNSALALATGKAQADGFYAIAYQFTSGPNAGQVTISYRGTDSLGLFNNDNIGSDILYGYGPGAAQAIGNPATTEALDALTFYQTIYKTTHNISVTGHSLGGGLAGMVSELYNAPGVIFDNMAFQAAAANTYEAATNLPTNLPQNALSDVSQILNENTLRQDIYGFLHTGQNLAITVNPGDTPSGLGEEQKTINANIPALGNNETAYFLRGQWLAFNSSQQSGTKTILTSNGSLVANDGSVDSAEAALESEIGGGLTNDGLHSMAALVINLYAQDGNYSYNGVQNSTEWENAAQYYWPLIFNNTFATDIGINSIGGNDSASDKLRNIIAYSAINSGTEIFGDVGIQAFYHDADTLGQALGTEKPNGTYASTTSTELTKVVAGDSAAKDISEAFVQFAAQMAKEKVSAEALPGVSYKTLQAADTAADGILSLTGDPVLNVNFSTKLWETGQTGLNVELPEMVARDDLFDNIMTNDTAQASTIYSYMGQLWDSALDDGDPDITEDNASDDIGQISFATTNSGAETINAAADSDQATLFVGGTGTNNIYVSAGNNIILAEGTDTVHVSGISSSDLIVGNGSTTVEANATYAGRGIYITDGSEAVPAGSTVAVGVHNFVVGQVLGDLDAAYDLGGTIKGFAVPVGGYFNIDTLGNTFSLGGPLRHRFQHEYRTELSADHKRSDIQYCELFRHGQQRDDNDIIIVRRVA